MSAILGSGVIIMCQNAHIDMRFSSESTVAISAIFSSQERKRRLHIDFI